MQLKRYLENLLHLCSDEAFGQNAVEWGLVNGHVQLTYDLDTDLRLIMGDACHPTLQHSPTPAPQPGCYDQLCAGYRHHCAQALVEFPLRPRLRFPETETVTAGGYPR